MNLKYTAQKSTITKSFKNEQNTCGKPFEKIKLILIMFQTSIF